MVLGGGGRGEEWLMKLCSGVAEGKRPVRKQSRLLRHQVNFEPRNPSPYPAFLPWGRGKGVWHPPPHTTHFLFGGPTPVHVLMF